jgi:hypothetical protein
VSSAGRERLSYLKECRQGVVLVHSMKIKLDENLPHRLAILLNHFSPPPRIVHNGRASAKGLRRQFAERERTDSTAGRAAALERGAG